MREEVTLKPSTGMSLAFVLPILLAVVAGVTTLASAKADVRQEMRDGYVSKDHLATVMDSERKLSSLRYANLQGSLHSLEKKLDRVLEDK